MGVPLPRPERDYTEFKEVYVLFLLGTTKKQVGQLPTLERPLNPYSNYLEKMKEAPR